MSLFEFGLIALPVGVTALLIGWLVAVDRLGSHDSGGHDRAIERAARKRNADIDRKFGPLF
jgi:hypothetical protein